jgi:hypothetical protein
MFSLDLNLKSFYIHLCMISILHNCTKKFLFLNIYLARWRCWVGGGGCSNRNLLCLNYSGCMVGFPRWKSQRIKIHRLGHRFPIDFKIHTLGYSFLLWIHKHLAKVSRLLVRRFLFLKFLRFIGWCRFSYGFFSCFECVSSMFCLKLLLILNFTNADLSKITFRRIFVS